MRLYSIVLILFLSGCSTLDLAAHRGADAYNEGLIKMAYTVPRKAYIGYGDQ